MLAHLFLIESSSKLLVTRTGIKARTSLILGRIRLLTLELLALEWRKFHIFKLGIPLKPVNLSWPNFMCSINGVGERLHKVLGQIGSKLVSMATESPCWLIMGKMMSPPFLGCFWSGSFNTCRLWGHALNLGRVRISIRLDNWLRS